MSGFVKVYSSILASSVWGENLATRVVWITMLAMADRNGLVEASSDGIARAANVTLKQADAALEVLSSPDPRSKTEDEHEGRRVTRCDGGFRILNYLKYRELQTPKQKATAERQRRFRIKHQREDALRNAEVTRGDASVTQRNAQRQKQKQKQIAEANTETTSPASPKPKPRTWIGEGVEWWASNVGTITEPRFGKALKDAVVTHGWPKVFEALQGYVADAKSQGKATRVEWFANDLIKWLEWAKMPATDDKGDLTPRGRAVLGLK